MTSSSAADTWLSDQTSPPAYVSAAQRRARRRAQVLPVPVVIRIEQATGVEQYGAYIPVTDQTTYNEHVIVDGQRYGRMGSEIVRPAQGDADMLSLAEIAAAQAPTTSAVDLEACRNQAERLRRDQAYALIEKEFPEEFAHATIRENGRVQCYVPSTLRERSRSRDKRRARYFVKQAVPPVPPMPSMAETRGRQMRARCATPTFFSALGDAPSGAETSSM